MPAHLLSAGNVICMEAEGNAAACDARLRDAYRTAFGVDPARSVFFEDSARNLTPAKAMGMQTVWLDFGTDWGARAKDEGAIDETIDDLAAWLDALADGGHLR